MTQTRILQDHFEFSENVTCHVTRYESTFEIFHEEYEGLFHAPSTQFLSAVFWAGGL
jgi:hypothetical protein